MQIKIRWFKTWLLKLTVPIKGNTIVKILINTLLKSAQFNSTWSELESGLSQTLLIHVIFFNISADFKPNSSKVQGMTPGSICDRLMKKIRGQKYPPTVIERDSDTRYFNLFYHLRYYCKLLFTTCTLTMFKFFFSVVILISKFKF